MLQSRYFGLYFHPALIFGYDFFHQVLAFLESFCFLFFVSLRLSFLFLHFYCLLHLSISKSFFLLLPFQEFLLLSFLLLYPFCLFRCLYPFSFLLRFYSVFEVRSHFCVFLGLNTFFIFFLLVKHFLFFSFLLIPHFSSYNLFGFLFSILNLLPSLIKLQIGRITFFSSYLRRAILFASSLTSSLALLLAALA